MTQTDESPKEGEGPYWSKELLAVLVVGLGDETQARETLEGIIQRAGPVVCCSLGSHAPSREPFAVALSELTWSPAGLC